MNRVIDTIDGDVLVKTAYDCGTDCSYLEFFVRDGYDEECFPWKYVAECTLEVYDDLEDIPEDVLADLYYEAAINA